LRTGKRRGLPGSSRTLELLRYERHGIMSLVSEVVYNFANVSVN
jgi:hypothetical protein